jgi:hypothetical protein
MPRFVQIVPRVPPGLEAVSATAHRLAAALGERGGVATALSDGSGLAAALRTQSPDAVLLHYVNYAYDPHGTPRALVAAAEAWGTRHPGRLWTYFHEVYATGAPWRRTFWTSWIQKRLAARLAHASGWCLTSLPLYAELLAILGCPTEIVITPVPSPIGEAAELRPHSERGPRLMVFGSAGRRHLAYTRERAALSRVCATLAIDEIHDVGAGDVAPPGIGSVGIRRHGAAPDEVVQELLLSARAGFVAYPHDFLGKSSIFAAYTAHGALAVCSGEERTRGDDPRPGIHYWDPRRPLESGAADLASNGHAWYQAHSLPRLVEQLAGKLERL